MTPALTNSELERFWSKVDRSGGPEVCWPWLAGLDKDGYGKFQIGPHRRQVHLRAHRVALAVTTPPTGEVVRHSCDNPICVNPAHLSYGTQWDNVRDRVARGHQRRGEDHPHATLSPTTVTEARRAHAAGESVSAIARRLGLGRCAIRDAVHRKTWRHVP